MTALKFIGIPTDDVQALQSNGKDAYGMAPEVHPSSGPGCHCRHCLTTIKAEDDMLVLAYQPFEENQPYAETGPIFLHKETCDAYSNTSEKPEIFSRWDEVIVRGYSKDNRIDYHAAKVIKTAELELECRALLKNPEVAYLHVRTTKYHCFQCRIERA
ncbi:DUF1203 domain-containing protein [Kordiimonas laminariae]|uniref:DUF1203 domain-containing protein n=1 Tax=Kordiimonas laminariae TaxID=2917717 RepID=UPI001FF5705E|nr:DUF1203 domain-containing protein [Kordiimonas laminariae]MCK0068390.1 DUF1203 domain-containing protein [Kordiimonas laminariae]